ncbi:Fic family protein [Candidatus Parcubacteria bacterium]|nr:Fic family protein [Candidatus Parcubacteria bacterium]
MNVSEKLKIIKRLSGLTQENLAKKLGVSFATLNSWINGKSKPRKSKLESIDKLLLKYTGVKVSGDDEKTAVGKKEIIHEKAKKYKDVLSLILKRVDLYDQLILSLTYNTNRIEGGTLTEDETAAVIFRNETIKNKNLIEHLEAKNHQSAIKFLFDYLSQKGKIDEKLILKLHSILMNGIRDDAGYYRRHGVRIVGSNVPTANYFKVPELMEKLIKENNQKHVDTIEHAAHTHSRFEQIHPFSDGNGRIGRLILSAMLLKDNLPPAVIEIKEKGLYLNYLRKSQLSGDFAPLEDFMCDSILNGFKIMEG